MARELYLGNANTDSYLNKMATHLSILNLKLRHLSFPAHSQQRHASQLSLVQSQH